MRAVRVAVSLGLPALLSACAVGPDYHTPAVNIPVTWKVEAPWRTAAPNDALDKGPWWERYGDPDLNKLEEQVLAANPTLVLAASRLTQARAQASVASSGLFPTVGVSGRTLRSKISGNRPLTKYNSPNESTVQNDFGLTFTASYEFDLFGRVQRTIEGAQATVQQTAADLANTRLVLTAELAADYVNLREVDTELDVLERSIALQRRALEIITSRYQLGATSGLEVAQQQTLLDTTLTQVDLLRKQRSQFEHAIATLVGVPAPVFSMPPKLRDLTPPAVPIGVPSDVLQRRPDVASAERAMAAANARIGVATAAFYPSFVMGPAFGLDSAIFGSLFNAPSMLWSLGVSTTQTLFDAGRTRANVDFARAGYEGTVANYRQVILSAMQQVEDGITGLAALDRASAEAQIAVTDARRALDLATSRYSGGATTYLDVITAQQSVLSTERQAAQLLGQRLLTSVSLVKALGGDWTVTSAEQATAKTMEQAAEQQRTAQPDWVSGKPSPSATTPATSTAATPASTPPAPAALINYPPLKRPAPTPTK
jgi:multidrug efflux system outer membrane protein